MLTGTLGEVFLSSYIVRHRVSREMHDDEKGTPQRTVAYWPERVAPPCDKTDKTGGTFGIVDHIIIKITDRDRKTLNSRRTYSW